MSVTEVKIHKDNKEISITKDTKWSELHNLFSLTILNQIAVKAGQTGFLDWCYRVMNLSVNEFDTNNVAWENFMANHFLVALQTYLDSKIIFI